MYDVLYVVADDIYSLIQVHDSLSTLSASDGSPVASSGYESSTPGMVSPGSDTHSNMSPDSVVLSTSHGSISSNFSEWYVPV